MELFYYIFSSVLIFASLLPFISDQHWVFRIFDFARIQLLYLLTLSFLIGFIFVEEKGALFWVLQGLMLALIFYSSFKLLPYTKIYPSKRKENPSKDSRSVTVLSVNVEQTNLDYRRLIDLVNEEYPDILLTMESNKDWEDALRVLDSQYAYTKKIPLENTYGMHFYSKLKVHDFKVHFFVADDVPSLEAVMETHQGERFTFFGVHPPPPGPTQEPNSKERDGELLSVAKKVKKLEGSAMVIGDFNNVAWARSSVLFRKTSGLIDPRIGHGMVSTFHAKSKLLRCPIDLFFHTPDVIVEEFKTLRPIGSDHLPLYCRFYFSHSPSGQEKEREQLEPKEHGEVDEMIKDGKEENGDR